MVQECQAAKAFPDVAKTTLAGLLFATTHGLTALEASGRMHSEKRAFKRTEQPENVHRSAGPWIEPSLTAYLTEETFCAL